MKRYLSEGDLRGVTPANWSRREMTRCAKAGTLIATNPTTATNGGVCRECGRSYWWSAKPPHTPTCGNVTVDDAFKARLARNRQPKTISGSISLFIKGVFS